MLLNIARRVSVVACSGWPAGLVVSVSSRRRMTSGATTNSSVDDAELKRFRKLANQWWIENGEFEALHRLNKLRVPMIRDAMINYRRTSLSTSGDDAPQAELTTPVLSVSEPLLGLNILDIGCGGGLLTEPLARLGANVTGVDMLAENISVAQSRAQAEYEASKGALTFYERIRYYNCSVEDLAAVAENESYFDAVVMSEVIEHVSHPDTFLANSSKLLKNHGFLFLTTINKTMQSYLLAIVAAEYVLGLVPRGTHTWDKFITPEHIKHVLAANEVFVKFNMGMCYNPLLKSWSWSNDESINYALYAQKLQTSVHQ